MLATRGSPLLSDMSAGIAGLLRSRVGETLSSLDLSRCRLSANFAAPELVSALAHSGVTELLLNDNRLEDVGIIQLSGVFAYGTCKLRRLELAGNRLKKNGLEQLIERIASSDVKLRVLDIGSSQPIDIRGYVQENFAARTRLRLQLHGITVLRSTDGATVAEGFDPY
ncbi:hypothetical protein SARC_10300 [Sphaeroforma arctica JP610]|uniref:Uncharacterized protein n=1 Tax=Sphaeroforma arctica JP610 TaxID=667725 RepID=A0A0L0FMI0_9EUKA|nr:hypothetical protein SARC_10300 [Sphaeroforma arctica JP610]KNC77238.1 hypothetical protein SARC_10300 [Sphaeroforma arctica JP610]|eukprot:XP_014151140.1 hypothetical protein SARC_10300 [Sphaeroforma arctica JP610]